MDNGQDYGSDLDFKVELTATILANCTEKGLQFKYKSKPRRKEMSPSADDTVDAVVPDSVSNILKEILKSYYNRGIIPAQFNIEIAYVVFKNADRKELLAAYDVSRLRESDEKVLSARYVRDKQPDEGIPSTNILEELSDLAVQLNIADKVRWLHHAGFIHHEVSIVDWKAGPNGDFEIGFNQTVRVSRYPLGEVCKALPLPGFRDPHRWAPENRPDHVFVVGEYDPTSTGEHWKVNEGVWRNLCELTRILEKEPAEALDLLGATGKNAFAEAIHHGFSRARDRFMAIDAARHHKWETLEAELFGYRSAKGLPDSAVGSLVGGTLFIDNTDWIPEESRTYLMGAVHSGRYLIEQEGGVQEVVFAATRWIVGHSQHLAGAEASPNHLKLTSPFDGSHNYVNALVFYWIFRELTSGFPRCIYDVFEKPNHPDVTSAKWWLNIDSPLGWKRGETGVNGDRKDVADSIAEEVKRRLADTSCYNFADAKSVASEVWFRIKDWPSHGIKAG